jgi:hypothetical protein
VRFHELLLSGGERCIIEKEKRFKHGVGGYRKMFARNTNNSTTFMSSLLGSTLSSSSMSTRAISPIRSSSSTIMGFSNSYDRTEDDIRHGGSSAIGLAISSIREASANRQARVDQASSTNNPYNLPLDRTYTRGVQTVRNTAHVLDTFNNSTGEGVRVNKETGETRPYHGTRSDITHYDGYTDRGYVESTR